MLRKPYFLVVVVYLILNTPLAYSSDIQVTDGDTIKINGIKFRLLGIDAPELNQKCIGNKNVEWDCGKCAKAFLEGIISVNEVTCESQGEDKYKRTIAICYANEKEINQEIIKAGYAIAYRQYSSRYVEDEKLAKEHKKGIWAGQFVAPQEYRKAKKVKPKSEL